MKISERLRALGNGEILPKNHSVGICKELRDAHGEYIPRDYYSDWEHFSGDLVYPVPGDTDECPRITYLDQEDQWDGSEYARKRRELCLHLAKKYEENGR